MRNAGSDTMVNLAQAWAERYAAHRPSVSVEVSGGGTATGIVALMEGAVDLANCSRPLEASEAEAIRRKTGAPARQFLVGHDALAVFVHRSNPLTEISLPQLAQLYGRQGRPRLWTDFAPPQPTLPSGEVILISRQNNSGTFHYFRQAVLGSRGDFRPGTRDLNGSKEVVSLIGHTPAAIGYSGMGYATEAVKMLRVSKTTGGEAYAPTVANTLTARYPLSRPLFIYTRAQLSPAVADYLRWILAADGQRVLQEAGYVPMPSPESLP